MDVRRDHGLGPDDRELVRRLRRHDEHLTADRLELFVADGEQGAPVPDDEGLRIRMLVQARP